MPRKAALDKLAILMDELNIATDAAEPLQGVATVRTVVQVAGPVERPIKDSHRPLPSGLRVYALGHAQEWASTPDSAQFALVPTPT